MGAKSSSRQGQAITLIAIHTNEGMNPADVFPDYTAENLARYLDGVQASYHKIVDDDSVVTYVPEHLACWALRSGNTRSLNLCFTGQAKWSTEEWLRHRDMLQRGARIVRQWCDVYQIPQRKISSQDVRANLSGICGHVNWTEGKQDGTHWDPGPNFPWDIFIGYINGAESQGAEDDMQLSDKFRDWNGLEQTYLSWMNNVDRRLAVLFGDAKPNDKHASRRVDTGQVDRRVSNVEAKVDRILAILEKRGSN